MELGVGTSCLYSIGEVELTRVIHVPVKEMI